MKKNLTKQLILMAFFAIFSTGLFAQDIVITEIMYNPPESGNDSLEFVEILNNSGAAYDMTDATFTAGNSSFTFPSLTLNDSEYAVVAVNDTAFFSVFGFYPYEWEGPGLSNGGKFIELKDANGSYLDSLTYDDGNGWDEAADGDGPSLVLCDVNADNNDGASWIAATTGTGVMINGKEIKANPNAASGCPTSMTLEADAVSTLKDIFAVFDVLGNDVIPGGVTSMTVGTTSMGGTVAVSSENKIEYTPPAGQCDIVDVFDYTVVSGGDTKSATVTVTVSCAPAYSIGLVTTENADGVADSVGTACILTGVVYGVDMIGGNGLQLTLIDANGDGIQVRHGNMELGYTVVEGDEITVIGQVGQFNGLTQFEPVSVTMNSAGNALLDATVVSTLGEATESRLTKLETMFLVDATQWKTSGSFNVEVTNGGADTMQLRIDSDIDVVGNTDFPANLANGFHVTGLGGQYDNSSPYTEGYQLFPRYAADFDILTNTNNSALQQKISIYPNPTSSDFVIESKDIQIDAIRLVNIMGQTLQFISGADQIQSVSLAGYPQGTYFVQITAGASFTTMKIAKK